MNASQYKALQERKAGKAPLCACGCGRKVLWNVWSKKYNRFLFLHHQRDVRHVKLSPRQLQIIMGTALGDGSIQFIRNRKTHALTGTARLRIRHSTKRQLAYIRWLRQELDPICGMDVKIAPNAGFGKEAAYFNTLSHPTICRIGEAIYGPKKFVSLAYLRRLNALGLAVWWMDDGSTMSIATHGFTMQENRTIVRWFWSRWKIRCFVDMDRRVNRPFIRTRMPDTLKLLKVVFPHAHRSLWYKFGRFLPQLLQGRSSRLGERDGS
jgi:hypothetical protein